MVVVQRYIYSLASVKMFDPRKLNFIPTSQSWRRASGGVVWCDGGGGRESTSGGWEERGERGALQGAGTGTVGIAMAAMAAILLQRCTRGRQGEGKYRII